MSELYVGLISGTSVDGIDAALVDLSTTEPCLLAHHCEAIPGDVRQRIEALCTPGNNEIERLGVLDVELGEHFASAANNLLAKAKLDASQIRAIGSHGQTVRHRPASADQPKAFTLQIGDPNTIAAKTGICVVADFRRRDMAHGGQGAPFAPAFHQALAPGNDATTAFLNLGGIANLTLVHDGRLVCGFDTGPANGLMDAWIKHVLDKPFDRDGDWAATGKVQQQLLQQLHSHSYFRLAAPKSTGRETFNIDWLLQELEASGCEEIPAEDVQATLLQLSVDSIVEALGGLPHSPANLYLCGGGAHNNHFCKTLEHALGRTAVKSSGELGIEPDWIEACAFAWLAQQRLENRAIALQQVTGASRTSVAGAIYHA